MKTVFETINEAFEKLIAQGSSQVDAFDKVEEEFEAFHKMRCPYSFEAFRKKRERLMKTGQMTAMNCRKYKTFAL